MDNTNTKNVAYKCCSTCSQIKELTEFYTGIICRECHNHKRREKYKNDEKHRKQLIAMSSNYKHAKVLNKQHERLQSQLKIGLDNKQCKYCNEIKHKDAFRHKRLKCRTCERDEPTEKFKRYIRTRIYNCLRNSNKSKHSIDYLGCSSVEYFKWIFKYNENYNLSNHGKLWHVDHVIPISKFDLNNQEQQLIAFNWRNTMPLSCEENLKKNNKIIQLQVTHHLEHLKKYHLENELDLPQVFIDLFAKHLDAGNP
jgi:hypothetical protein